MPSDCRKSKIAAGIAGLIASVFLFSFAGINISQAHEDQGQDQFCICHNTSSSSHPKETIVVAEPAVCTHIQQHGDTSGPCPGDDADDCKGAPGIDGFECGPGDGDLTCGLEPADIVLMLDRTGSVSSSNRNKERDAARSFIDLVAGLGNGSRIAVGRFGDNTNGGTEAEMRASLSTDYAGLKTTVTNAMSSSSHVGTNLKDAIHVAQGELDANASFSKRVIILLTDGDANEPGSSSAARTAAINEATSAKAKGTTIITVSFDASLSSDKVFRDATASMASQPSDDDTSGAVDDAERDAENADGDFYFIAPNGDDLKKIFDNIFEKISCDDSNPCTKDSCNEDTGKCVNDPIPDCNACESKEDCNDHDPCTDDACDTDSHKCEHSNNTATCDDGNPCTKDDTCGDGSCSGTLIEGCKTCDSKEDCQDNTVCNGTEVCVEGVCEAGTELNCEPDTNVCTDDICDPVRGCVHDNNTDSCDDDNPCTEHDTCAEGGCTGTPIEGCQQCETEEDCQDATVCNGTEVCSDGVCQAGTPLNCEPDSNECTDDVCDAVQGCIHPNNTAPCNDGNECTENDACSGGACDGTLIGECQTCESNSDCDDHNACNGVETCGDNHTCVAGTPLDCNDQTACTDDSCNAETGCVNVDNGICNPQSLCIPQDCNDNNPCTDDVCDAQIGCIHTGNGSCSPTPECVDQDGDTICDPDDNCPTVANTDQADSNGNGVGDACDTPENPENPENPGGNDSGAGGAGGGNTGICIQSGGGFNSKGGGSFNCGGSACSLNRAASYTSSGGQMLWLSLGLTLVPWMLLRGLPKAKARKA